MDEAEAKGEPITLEEAIQKTFKTSPEITKAQAINLAIKARELSEMSGTTPQQELDGLLAEADRISGAARAEGGTTYTDPKQVQADYASGKLSRAQAEAELKKLGLE